MNVSRPVAVVTNASRGCGGEIAVELAGCGFDIALVDTTDSFPQATIDAICARDALATWHCADMADLEGHARLLDGIEAESGEIACLVNHAPLRCPADTDLLDVDPADFDRIVERALRSTFFITQRTARRMVRSRVAGPRSIITVSPGCTDALAHDCGAACLARGSLKALTRMFARRLSALDIGVFEVRPGRRSPDAPATPARLQPQRVGRTVAAVASGQLAFASGSVIDVEATELLSHQ